MVLVNMHHCGIATSQLFFFLIVVLSYIIIIFIVVYSINNRPFTGEILNLYIAEQMQLPRDSLPLEIQRLAEDASIQEGHKGIQNAFIRNQGQIKTKCANFHLFTYYILYIIIIQTICLANFPSYSRLTAHLAVWKNNKTRSSDSLDGPTIQTPIAILNSEFVQLIINDMNLKRMYVFCNTLEDLSHNAYIQ